jgi:hypothetical protein
MRVLKPGSGDLLADATNAVAKLAIKCIHGPLDRHTDALPPRREIGSDREIVEMRFGSITEPSEVIE